MKVEVELLKEIAPLKEDTDGMACVSCIHQKSTLGISMYDNLFHAFQCDIDGHYISYFGLWRQTCKHHDLVE